MALVDVELETFVFKPDALTTQPYSTIKRIINSNRSRKNAIIYIDQ